MQSHAYESVADLTEVLEDAEEIVKQDKTRRFVSRTPTIPDDRYKAMEVVERLPEPELEQKPMPRIHNIMFVKGARLVSAHFRLPYPHKMISTHFTLIN